MGLTRVGTTYRRNMATAMTSRASHFELKFLKSQEADHTADRKQRAHALHFPRITATATAPTATVMHGYASLFYLFLSRRDIHKHRRPDI
jgi:hypothetical protein